MTENDFYEIQKVYLEMTSYTDWIFSELMIDALQQSSKEIQDNTAVFFSSDHGDFAGDYHMVEKWPGGSN